MAKRKAIPKAIADKLLVEAMHRCCLCPEHRHITHLHHIVQVCEGGSNAEDNLMVICPSCHDEIHRIRGLYNEAQLRMYKEQWVRLCALGLTPEERLAQAFDYRAPPAPPEPARETVPRPPEPDFVHPYPMQAHFTGRAAERQRLTEWLTGGAEPVFALVALGGMGKSALTWAWVLRDVLGLDLAGAAADLPETAAACRTAEAARPEGVLWWSFYERESSFGAFLDRAIRYASGGTCDPGKIESAHDKVRQVLSLLEHRRILLVLDGFERELRTYAHLGAAYQGDGGKEDERGDFRSCADPHAAAFLAGAAALPLKGRVLMTSRLSPKELDGLAGGRHEELLRMDPEDAVAFFESHGIRGTRAEIQEACTPYDYLPLALRLLAGVIARDKRTPGDVKVAKRYPVLPHLKGKEQHHILQVAFETLGEPKREALSRIAAFRSGITYEAVSIFNTFGSVEAFDAALEEMIDRGLLFFDREKRRYDLHPIVRQYAYDRLTDKAGVHTRLRDYFAAVPEPEKVETLDDLAPVIELYHHTVRAGLYDEARDLFGDRLAATLYYRFGAYGMRIELLRALFPDGEDRPPRLKDEAAQAWTLNALAVSYSLSGQPRRAVPLSEMHNAVRRKAADKTNLARGLVNLALDQDLLGQLKAAEGNLRRSIALSREVKHEFVEAVGHRDMGRLLAYRGEFAEAATELKTALGLFTKEGATQSQCVVWAYRALRALLMDDGPAALAAARQARKLADEVARTHYPHERDFIRAEWLIGAALVAAATTEKGRRDEALAEAEGHLTEALTRCRRINLVELETGILLAWARWHRARGNAAEAQRCAREVLSIADRCEYRLVQADGHNLLARLALDAGDKAGARKEAEAARERALCDGPPYAYKPALDEADRLLREAGG